jgi:hypothetical protein
MRLETKAARPASVASSKGAVVRMMFRERLVLREISWIDR